MSEFSAINPIQSVKIPEIPSLGQTNALPKTDEKSPSFSKVLGSFFNDVNQMQVTAQESAQKMATGEIKDVHQVMIAMNEADVAFKMMMEIRNKLVQAYNELMKTPI